MPRRRVSSPLCTSRASAVRLFVIYSSVLFFCLLAALLIPTSPYSIEQYNMRDLHIINEKDYESCILTIKNTGNSTEMHA